MKAIPFTIRDRGSAGRVMFDVAGAVVIVVETENVDDVV